MWQLCKQKYYLIPVRKAAIYLLLFVNKKDWSNKNIKNFNFCGSVKMLKQLIPKKNGIYNKIIAKFLGNPKYLKLVYAIIQNKKNYMLFDLEVIYEGVTQEWFWKVAYKLKTETYEFESNQIINMRHRHINKKIRILTVRNFKDKIIQKAIELILEKIYDYKNKSYHNILKQIKKKWNNIPWYLKVDIKKTFNSINQNILISRLKLKIRDQSFFNLIIKMFKAKSIFFTQILKKSWNLENRNVLIDIYFHGLDNKWEACNSCFILYVKFINNFSYGFCQGKKLTFNDKYNYSLLNQALSVRVNFLENKFYILVEIIRTYKTFFYCFSCFLKDCLICVMSHLVNYI